MESSLQAGLASGWGALRQDFPPETKRESSFCGPKLAAVYFRTHGGKTREELCLLASGVHVDQTDQGFTMILLIKVPVETLEFKI